MYTEEKDCFQYKDDLHVVAQDLEKQVYNLKGQETQLQAAIEVCVLPAWALRWWTPRAPWRSAGTRCSAGPPDVCFVQQTRRARRVRTGPQTSTLRHPSSCISVPFCSPFAAPLQCHCQPCSLLASLLFCFPSTYIFLTAFTDFLIVFCPPPPHFPALPPPYLP